MNFTMLSEIDWGTAAMIVGGFLLLGYIAYGIESQIQERKRDERDDS